MIPANADTVHWGYFSKDLSPQRVVHSNDLITIETLTHHANDDSARMVQGDPGAESVFRWEPGDKGVDRRGAGPMDASTMGRGAGEGFGVHVLTGPVYVCGAEPGDVLEVRILDVNVRPSANPAFAGKAFGSNVAAKWGFQYNDYIEEPKQREMITIYEIDATGAESWARAVYNFRWTPQTDPDGVVHETIDYPGLPIDRSTISPNSEILQEVRIPVRLHFGTMGVAPENTGYVDSVPPSSFGGNIDNWRVGKGATMYYPIAVPGALLSVGDPHGAQGDSELNGTAIEMSLTGLFQVVLHKANTLNSTPLEGLDYPLLETDSEWVVHGFSYPDYLKDLGPDAQKAIFEKSSLDSAMKDAFRKMRRFLMTTKGLSEDEALSVMSIAADFGVTQVVDGNWGVHGVIEKRIFIGDPN
jgi:acetamidase/formamidase